MMGITDIVAIESLGHLLANYKSDLEYIALFDSFRKNEITADIYLTERNSGFQGFINEFRVARNIKKEKVKDLVCFIKKSMTCGNSWTVDKFAEEIKKEKFTHEGKVMVVLVSKIFFLAQPETIIPMDSLNKKALGLKGNKYEDFESKINNFIEKNRNILPKYLSPVCKYLEEIEKSINIKIDFEKYRMNRFTDKYLWAKGRK